MRWPWSKKKKSASLEEEVREEWYSTLPERPAQLCPACGTSVHNIFYPIRVYYKADPMPHTRHVCSACGYCTVCKMARDVK